MVRAGLTLPGLLTKADTNVGRSKSRLRHRVRPKAGLQSAYQSADSSTLVSGFVGTLPGLSISLVITSIGLSLETVAELNTTVGLQLPSLAHHQIKISVTVN